MREISQWRKGVATTSLALVIINPIYWFIVVKVISSRFQLSDNVWGNLIVAGVLIGIVSLVCAFFGAGSNRWKLVIAAFVETFFWWFMAVGL